MSTDSNSEPNEQGNGEYLPPSPAGKPYTARIEAARMIAAQDGVAVVMQLRIRSPRQYRNLTVVNVIPIDPLAPQIIEWAANQLKACGLTEQQLETHPAFCSLIIGRTIRFQYAPANESKHQRIDIEGVLYVPDPPHPNGHSKTGRNGKEITTNE